MLGKEKALAAVGMGMFTAGIFPAAYNSFMATQDIHRYIPDVHVGWSAQSPVGGPEFDIHNELPAAALILSLGFVASGLTLTYRNIRALDDYDAFDETYRHWQAQGMPVARNENTERPAD